MCRIAGSFLWILYGGHTGFFYFIFYIVFSVCHRLQWFVLLVWACGRGPLPTKMKCLWLTASDGCGCEWCYNGASDGASGVGTNVQMSRLRGSLGCFCAAQAIMGASGHNPWLRLPCSIEFISMSFFQGCILHSRVNAMVRIRKDGSIDGGMSVCVVASVYGLMD